MKSLRNEGKFKPSFVKNIEILSRDYAAWRRVRGDGNSYYRAVMSNYILKIFHYYSNREKINQLIVLLQGIQGEFPYEFITAKEYFIDYLKQHYDFRQNLEASIESFKNVNLWLQERDFDLNLVRIARVISVDAFQNTFDEYSAFMLDDEKAEISGHLLKMGREAEGLELLLLQLGLGICVCVKQINLFENLLPKFYLYEDEWRKEDKVKITIICNNKGHYDMLYPMQRMKDEEYNVLSGKYHYPQNPVKEMEDEEYAIYSGKYHYPQNFKPTEHSPSPSLDFQIYPVVDSEIVETISKTWLPMESLKNEVKLRPSFVKNIESLSRNYSAWRRVRGDGNCYYRAVMSNYILKIFHYYSNKDRINQLIILLEGIRMEEFPHEFIAANDYFIDYLTKHYDFRQNLEASVESFKNVNQWLQERDFDLNLVRIARVISVYAFQYKFDHSSGCMLDDEKAEFSGNLLKMGREAEGIELFLLPLGLGICVEQINLFENILRTFYPNEVEAKKEDKVKITIICKNNDHYDILYPVKDMDDEGYNIDLGRYYYTRF